VEFRILGSLEAVSGGRRLRLGGSCEQRLLAALLLDADQVVPVARLAESIWDDPPATAAKQVRNRVSRLRRMLAAAEPGDFIVTDADGYRIAAEAIELDARRFQAGVTRSHQAASAGRTDEAAEWLRSALALWRGPALSGLGGRSLQAVAAAWDERRCAAMETYYGYQLQMGRHREILGELAASATAYPFREKLVGQYMLALYRCGVRADALRLLRASPSPAARTRQPLLPGQGAGSPRRRSGSGRRSGRGSRQLDRSPARLHPARPPRHQPDPRQNPAARHLPARITRRILRHHPPAPIPRAWRTAWRVAREGRDRRPAGRL
jgi:DNA-binding SARP family transcriptional activator